MVDYENFKFLNKVYINSPDKGEVGFKEAQPLLNLLLSRGIVLSARLTVKMLRSPENIKQFIAQARRFYGEILLADITNRDYELLDFYLQDPKYFERHHIPQRDETWGNAGGIEKQIPQETDSRIELDLMSERELKKYLVSLANAKSDWTSNEKRVFLKYYKKINNFFFQNSRNLYSLLQSMNAAEQKEFSKSYVVKQLEDLRIIICAVLNMIPNEERPKNRETHYPQWLKTLTMETLGRLSLFLELRPEVAKNKAFWNFVQYKITPTHKRFQKYRNAVKLLEIPAIKKAKSNESQITNALYESFEHEFKTYYNYNREFAFKNLLQIYSRWGSIEDDTLLKFAPKKIKSILDCIKAINKMETQKQKSAYHYGDKIQVKQTLERPNFFELRIQLVKLLKKTLKAVNYGRFKGKKILLDKSTMNTALPLNTRNTLVTEQYLPRGTIIPLGDEVKKIRLFCAWKRKDGEAGSLDLDVQLNAGGQKITKDNYAQFDAVKFSGDFNKCIKFNDENPIITTKFFDIDLELIDPEVVFSITSKTEENFEDYDIYVGVTKNLNLYNLKYIDLSDAEIFASHVSNAKNLVVLKYIKENNSIQFLDIPYNETDDDDTRVIASIYSNIKGLTYFDFLTMLVNDDSAFVDNPEKADIIVTNGRLRRKKVLNLCDLDLEIRELIFRELK